MLLTITQYCSKLYNKPVIKSLVAAIAAFIVYGGWAAYANYEFGTQYALRALFGQGGFAFSATLLLTLLAEYLYIAFGKNKQALAKAFSICVMISATLPATIHWLIGTPNILLSITPGFIFGSVYLFLYLRLLHRNTLALNKSLT
ncbi:hypothetical protein [Reinekea thalattae]|uniref:Uncharacterized protein n=1 Tax=Reinekea thalattae TaxID=2593301 RepID=A0A5C8Z9T9_9GAMM|nr:hypothetical protein [Reinekea thalattae]TXR53931.1 hypothetical protein FME95_05100 [Reinekea thalattae]